MAVSPNIGGGVHLIKPAKLYMCTQKHYKHNEDGHAAPGVRGHGSVPRSHSENVVTKIRFQQRASKVKLAKTSLDPELYCCFSVYLTSHYSNIS